MVWTSVWRPREAACEQPLYLCEFSELGGRERAKPKVLCNTNVSQISGSLFSSSPARRLSSLASLSSTLCLPLIHAVGACHARARFPRRRPPLALRPPPAQQPRLVRRSR